MRSAPRLGELKVLRPNGFHIMRYTHWSAAKDQRPRTLCIHGLTRNGRDFDDLAQDLSADRHVFCPDMLGRGQSDWLSSSDGYVYPLYLGDVATMIARIGASAVDFIGTSMGGVIGLLLAATRGAPLRRLVINDVGPLVSGAALRRIASYVGQNPHFNDLSGVEARLRQVHAPFGDLSDEHWARMAKHSSRPCPSGEGYRLAYDPQIAEALGDPETIQDVDLWTFWDMIDIPILVVRGAESDLLSAATVREMVGRGPGAKGLVTSLEVPGAGHAPTLADESARATVRRFLDG